MENSIVVFSYSSCSTCRKSLKWLDENKLQYKLKDIVNEPPSKQILRKAFEQYGERNKLFNTRGTSYRLLGAKKVKEMSDFEAIEALSLDGKLIKRPFLVIKHSEILVGFDQSIWSELLLG